MKFFGWEITKRSSIENPNVPLSQATVGDLWGTEPVSSGVNVNEHTALEFPAVWAAVTILSQAVSTLPVKLYRRTESGKEEVTDHPVVRAMQRPNDLSTGVVWRSTTQAHVSLWGNGYAEILPDMRLLPLHPADVRPEVIEESATGLDRAVYHVTQGARKRVLEAPQVLHIPSLVTDGVEGKSPIRVLRESIGLGIAAERFGAAFFGNGATLRGVIEAPSALGDKAFKRLKNDFRQYSGIKNAHKTPILEEGAKYHPLSVPPDDAQFIESRKLSIEDIARIYLIPPHMLASMDNATFSNIEHQGIDFVVNTLRPWLVRWEAELNLKLLGNDPNLYLEFNVNGLLRGDLNTRYQAYATGRQWGWLSANDIRRKENMNPVEGGDEYLTPLNMVPAGEAPDDERAQRVLMAAAGRQARREEKAITRALQGQEDFDAWLEGFVDDQRSIISENLAIDGDKAATALVGLLREPEIMSRLVQARTAQLMEFCNAD